ncbi:MAG: GNAT family N-acetyltransferase [Candidatus Methanoplasma sp.]|jgi:ribosomal protein S18 acetylase RimI-like enzyme|nr:GNAT family N-acetyltransferase [Candidatus Methanoplasma sp.]
MEFLDSSHAQEISDLARSIWMEYFPTIISHKATELIFDSWQSADAIKKQIDDEGFLYSFVVHDGEKIGYFSVRPEGGSLFISKIYVDKEHRGKGFGKRTLQEMIEYGRSLGSRNAYLHVNKNNKLAIGAYEANGFKVTGERYEPMGNGIFLDDYTMEYSY